MTIRFSKFKDKQDTLTCIRDDGTSTWSPLHAGLGAPHDIVHYVVESTLEYTEAFYGLLAGGRDISSFGSKNGARDVYPLEAIHAEHIVGLIQVELRSGVPLSGGEFCDMLAQTCANRDVPPPPSLTPEILNRLRASCADYLQKWDQLPEGGILEVVF